MMPLQPEIHQCRAVWLNHGNCRHLLSHHTEFAPHRPLPLKHYPLTIDAEMHELAEPKIEEIAK